MKKILFGILILLMASCDGNNFADTKDCHDRVGGSIFSTYGPGDWVFKPTHPIDTNIVLSPLHIMSYFSLYRENEPLGYSWAIDSLTKDTIPIFSCGDNPFFSFPKIISLDSGYYFILDMFTNFDGSFGGHGYDEDCEPIDIPSYCKKISASYISLDGFEQNPSPDYLKDNMKEMVFDSKNMTELHWIHFYYTDEINSKFGLVDYIDEMEKYKDSTNYYSTSGRYVKITETDTLVAVRPYLSKSNGILVDELDLTELDSIYTQQGYEIQKGLRYYGDIEKHIENIRAFLNDGIKTGRIASRYSFPIKEKK